ncbi:unnamed protein product [Mytilus coruscus]|uniref:MIB n=1 Tax=Mytilus coruscus TaxID=42192 RepID=A0A6J8B2R0_MYTCO|nr:unnamed protein product [Mytilus coruscus]
METQLDNRVMYHSKQGCLKGTAINNVPTMDLQKEESIRLNIKPEETSMISQERIHTPSRRRRRSQDEDDSISRLFDIDQPRTIREWLQYTNQIMVHASARMRSGVVKIGRSQDVILVLDTSERMTEYFQKLKSAALQYVYGIKHQFECTGIENGIGLAIFGRQTRLIQEATSDYDLILELLGGVRYSNDTAMQANMIVFTDGSSEQDRPFVDLDDNHVFSFGNLRVKPDANGVIDMIASTITKIFYVPVGKNHHNILLSISIASEIRYSNNHSREVIRRKIAEKSSFDDRHNDCLDMVQDFINPLKFENKQGNYVELKCNTLQLGDRVRRGPDWIYNNQDLDLPGTVVGQGLGDWIWVEWDHGRRLGYVFDEEMNIYQIRKVNEARILVNEMIAVGCRVIRGHDWKYGDYDGGDGSLGTVLEVKDEGKVIVRWDRTKKGVFKMGYKGLFEVRLCDDFVNNENTSRNINPNEHSFARHHINQNMDTNEDDPLDYVIPIYSDISDRLNNNALNFRYIIHFPRMIQENTQNKTEIQVRRKDVEKGVDSLATHCDLNSTKLNEIKELVFTLSKDVNNITETVRHIKESYIERTIEKGKKSENIKDRLENVSVSSTVSRKTGCLPNDGCISSPKIVKSFSSNDVEKYRQFETITTDKSNAYIRHADGGPCVDDNLDIDTLSEKNAFQSTNIFVSDKSDTNCQNDKLDLNGGKVEEKTEDDQIQTLSKSNGKMSRNDLGFKSLSTEWLYDNRVSFHSKGFEGTNCSPVSDVKKTVSNKPNIQQHSDFPDARSQFQSHRRLAGSRRRRNTGFLNVDSSDNSNMGLDTTIQPKTIHDWLKHHHHVCEHAKYRLRSGTVRRTGVRYVTLVLDISERLRGRKFEVMKKAAVEYVEGVKQVWLTTGLGENIGLAVFGEKNQLIHECTSELDLILRSIDELEPCGDAPAIGGLLMGMAGVMTGPRGSIGDFPLQGHIIIFTDSGSEGNTSSSNHAGVESVVHTVVESQTKVFYVQIGKDQKNAILERVVKETSGRIVDTREMQRLVLMTKIMILASRIATGIMHSSDQSKESIKQQIKEQSGSDDPYNDCLDMVLEFVNPLSVEKKRGNYTELTCRSLQLGDRVRRGPDWHYGNQDKHMAGTVIGEQSHGIARVQWDNGDTNIYMQCDETNTYNLRKVDEPRILVDEMIAVGCRVVRGPDWKFGNRDGGTGSSGTVLDVRPEGKVVVRWDSKRTGLYKMGHNGRFEIKVHGAPVRRRSKRNEHRSEYKSQHTSDSESENETLRPKFRTTRADVTQELTDYVIPIYSDATVSAIWEYQEGSVWKKYPNDINVKIEKAYQRKKTGKTIIEMDRTTIQVIRQKNPSAEKIKLGDNKENMSAENGKLIYIKLYTL